ncbi:MAG: hypothetical protein AB7V77_00755 [Candidatus Woesearchaeota archaeon]
MNKSILESVANKNIISLSNSTKPSKNIIKVFLSNKHTLSWKKVKEYNSNQDSIYIRGVLANRMLKFLKSNNRSTKYSKSDCHIAAFLTTGMIDYIHTIFPEKHFEKIYSEKSVEVTDVPQKPPAIVHLLHDSIETLITFGVEKFSGLNIPHSVLYIGNINGKEICFEKKGVTGIASFTELKSLENAYGTKYRWYIKI